MGSVDAGVVIAVVVIIINMVVVFVVIIRPAAHCYERYMRYLLYMPIKYT